MHAEVEDPNGRGASAAGQTLPDTLPQNVPFTELTGNWQFIPVPLPDRDVRHILVSKAQNRIWVGTNGGVASYDGIAARTPKFESVEAQQSIRVNSMIETQDVSVLVGSSNDSVWLWKGETIVNIFGACPGSACPTGDWAFARDNEGSIYVAYNRFGLQQTEALAKLKQAIPDHFVVVRTPASFLGFAGEKLIATSESGSIIDDRQGLGQSDAAAADQAAIGQQLRTQCFVFRRGDLHRDGRELRRGPVRRQAVDGDTRRRQLQRHVHATGRHHLAFHRQRVPA
ncbi:hypothetical protein QIH87_47635 [Bradyrhizobium elkanii]|uniref:hypothetical protein n=1 Tax=Bradyrhizobium elkanii TaxID=29448 RepID=UPI002714B94A|nr:hypothetical protein [Bradyrhizobium elkanii]WLB09518.1 hypothetical protein QIH87_47635 [Bradyrhizobium elkanii]WLB72534.1 hypothetical protein QIH89_00685 [Bradyrhizobium elkanii]